MCDLEQRIVTAGSQSAGKLNVVVQSPEVLHLEQILYFKDDDDGDRGECDNDDDHDDNNGDRGECDDLPLVLFPLFCLVVLEEPEGPSILKIQILS